jgi:hypothetical protein
MKGGRSRRNRKINNIKYRRYPSPRSKSKIKKDDQFVDSKGKIVQEKAASSTMNDQEIKQLTLLQEQQPQGNVRTLISLGVALL